MSEPEIKVAINPLESILIGIGAGDFHGEFVEQDITDELLPYLTKSDLTKLKIPKDKIDSIYQSICCLRPIELNQMNDQEKELFEEHSLRLTEAESTSYGFTDPFDFDLSDKKTNKNPITVCTKIVQFKSNTSPALYSR